MNLLRLLCVAALLSLGSQVFAQAQLGGVRHLGPGQFGQSDATYTIGLTLDGGASFVDSASINDDVELQGVIHPEPAHVGQTADIFIVDRVNVVNFTMRNSDGVFIDWNGNISGLVPFREDVVLTDSVAVDIFTGRLGISGDHRLFLGYLPADGVLRYTPIAQRIDITAQSSRDLAEALFASAVSPNVVQAFCITCHVSGGQADGQSLHRFVRTTNANHLSLNFTQFQNLLNARGKSYILSKVQGGSFHGGSVVLSGSSQAYRDLEQFLTLLEGL